MKPDLYVRVIGEPLVLNGERVRISFRVRKHLALLLFLVLEPRRRASRERLQRLLWPDGKGKQSLSQALLELRRSIGEEMFDIDDFWIALSPSVRIELDLDVIRTCAPELVIRQLAECGWSNTLLDSMIFEDAEDWNTWLATERDLVRQSFVEIGRTTLQDRDSYFVTTAERSQLLRWTRLCTSDSRIAFAQPQSKDSEWWHLDPRLEHAISAIVADTSSPAPGLHAPFLGDAYLLLAAAMSVARPDCRLIIADLPEPRGSWLKQTLLAQSAVLGIDQSSFDLIKTADESLPPSRALRTALGAAVDALLEDGPFILAYAATEDPWAETIRRIIDERRRGGTWCHAVSLSTPEDGYCALGRTYVAAPLDQSELQLIGLALAPALGCHPLSQRTLAECAGSGLALVMGMQMARHGLRPSQVPPSMASWAELLPATGAPPAALVSDLIEPATRVARSISHRRPTVTPLRRDEGQCEDDALRCALSMPADVAHDQIEDVILGLGLDTPALSSALVGLRFRLGLAHLALASEHLAEQLSALDGGNSESHRKSSYFLMVMASSPTMLPAHVSTLHSIRLNEQQIESGTFTGLSIAAAEIIRAQLVGDRIRHRAAIANLSAQRFTHSVDRGLQRWIAGNAALMGLYHLGDYRRARQTARQMTAAAFDSSLPSRAPISLANWLLSAFRCGQYREAVTVSRLIGRSSWNGWAKRGESYIVLAAIAAQRTGQLGELSFLRDLAEEHYVHGESAQSKLYGAEFLYEMRSHRRANVIAEEAIGLTPTAPPLQEEGLWAKWSSRFLLDKELETGILESLKWQQRIDARDRAMIRSVWHQRSLDSNLLGSALALSPYLPRSAME